MNDYDIFNLITSNIFDVLDCTLGCVWTVYNIWHVPTQMTIRNILDVRKKLMLLG